MKGTLVRALLLWVAVFMILQPILSYRDYLLDTIVKSNTYYLAQKSAVDGMVTESNKADVLDNLQRVGFRESDVSITYDSSVKDRGQRLDVVIQAKRAPSFAFNFGSESESNYYYGHAYVMSERVE